MNKKLGTIIPLGILLLSLLSLVPSVNATAVCEDISGNGSEDFEGYQTFFRPGYPETSTCLYAYPAVNSGYVVSSPVAPGGGTRAFYTQSAANARFDLNGPNLCTPTNPSGATATVWFRTSDAFSGNPDNYQFVGFGDGNGASGGLGIRHDGIPGVRIRSNNGLGQVNDFNAMPGAPALSLNTWYQATITLDCSSVTAVINIGGTDYGVTDATSFGGWPASGVASYFGLSTSLVNIGGNGGWDTYMDDFEISGYSSVGSAGYIFCANHLETNYGYDYVEDITYLSTQTGYNYNGFYGVGLTNSNTGYFGKAFPTGTTGLEIEFTVQADPEFNERSVIKAGVTKGTATLSAGSSGDTGGDMVIAGNGETTGNWAQSVQVIITETPTNSYQLGIYYTSGGSLTLIGSLVNYDVLSTLGRNFVFTVDSLSTLITLEDAQGNILIARNIPEVLQNSVWKDAWLMLKAVDSNAATTVINNNDDQYDSTCIFDTVGTAVVEGSSGTEPYSQVNPTTTSTSTTTSGSSTTNTGCIGCTVLPSTGPGSRPFGIDINYVAEGLGVSALGVQVLIGLILAVIFAIWLYRGTGSIVAAMLGVGMGIAVATVMGLIPSWVIMLIALALLIILGKMIFGGFSGGEES